MESGIPLHNDLSPESNTNCSDKQSVIEYLEDEIHIVEFRIKEFYWITVHEVHMKTLINEPLKPRRCFYIRG